MHPAARLDGIETSLIRQINALATPFSVNLGIGEPNVEPDGRFREMAAEATRGSWHYSANAGTLSLRKKLAAVLAPGFDPKTELCVTAGTEEGLFALMQAWVGTGDEVLVPNPGFLAYATVARICGATPVPYDLDPDGWRLDVDALARRVTERTKLIVVNTPSNPLGSVVDAETLWRIAELADERDLLVVSDEVYREIWYESPPPSMLGLGRNVLVLDGFSKSHAMTGLRLGWIAARKPLMGPIVKAHQYIATCASVFAQDLAERILDDAEWNAGWLARVREQFRTQRDAAMHEIERHLDVTIAPPAGAFYAFVPVPFCGTVDFARSLATDAAVLTIPGVAFGSAGEGFLRISYAASIDQIGSGIERIGRYMKELGR
jgi:aspartate/methionine/tyrosine aminotransferase